MASNLVEQHASGFRGGMHQPLRLAVDVLDQLVADLRLIDLSQPASEVFINAGADVVDPSVNLCLSCLLSSLPIQHPNALLDQEQQQLRQSLESFSGDVDQLPHARVQQLVVHPLHELENFLRVDGDLQCTLAADAQAKSCCNANAELAARKVHIDLAIEAQAGRA